MTLKIKVESSEIRKISGAGGVSAHLKREDESVCYKNDKQLLNVKGSFGGKKGLFHRANNSDD